MNFYQDTLIHLVNEKRLSLDDDILVLAGGQFDRDSFVGISARNVTISNLAPHAGHTDYAPYKWEYLDAELVDKPDNSFDWVVINAALHHLAVPAKGVCEMFRIARKGILCMESRDSLLMRTAVRLGFTRDYELEPAFISGGTTGGYRNGPLPNYVYRWTEREFEKVVNSFAPSHIHTFFYRYGYNVPLQRFAMARNPLYRTAGSVVSSLSGFARLVAPRQGNQFAFGVLKNVTIQPWLTEVLTFKNSYLESKYDRKKYWRNVS